MKNKMKKNFSLLLISFIFILVSGVNASEFMAELPTVTWISPNFNSETLDVPQPVERYRQNSANPIFNSIEGAESFIKDNFVKRTPKIGFCLPLQTGLDFINSEFTIFCEEKIYKDGYYQDMVGALKLQGESYYTTDTYLTLYMIPQYKSTLDEEEELELAISNTLNDIISDITSVGDKVKTIHDWIIMHNEYDLTYSNYRAYDAMILGTSVCQGYAALAYRMYQKANIPVVYITGEATNSTGSTEGHAWNMVNICDNWFHIDLTWDDPIPDGNLRYAYYLLSDSEIANNHTWISSDYPLASISYSGEDCSSSICNNPPLTGQNSIFLVNDDIINAPVQLTMVNIDAYTLSATLEISVQCFSEPIDLYVALFDMQSGNFYFIDPQGNLTLDWQTVKTGITEEVSLDIAYSNFTHDNYWVYWLIVPSNGGILANFDFASSPFELGGYEYNR